MAIIIENWWNFYDLCYNVFVMIPNRKTRRITVKFHNLSIECDYLENFESSNLLVLLPPSPIYGGSKNESVFNYMFSKLYNSNCSLVRFNFLNTIDEINKDTDFISRFSMQASLVIESIKNQIRVCQDNLCEISIVGLSTGAMVGLNLLMRRIDIKYLFMVSPTVTEVNLTEVKSFEDINNNIRIYYGTKDSVISSDKYSSLVKKIKAPERSFEGANHLFVNHEEALFNQIFSVLNSGPFDGIN
jgi:alpha/beta superfamily hydrolase